MTTPNSDSCPKCGANIVSGPECPHCGVIYAKVKNDNSANIEDIHACGVEHKELTNEHRDRRALFILACFLLLLFIVAKISENSKPVSLTEKNVTVVKKIPQHPLPRLQELYWSLGGFDNVLIASFTLFNGSDSTWKDIVVKCEGRAKSGTQLSSGIATVYDIITPGSILKVKNLNFGFTDKQAETATCFVVKAIEVEN